jgi:hypothetical protein
MKLSLNFIQEAVTMSWTPGFHQYRLGKNRDYLNSLWLGTAWAILTLPEILLFNLIVPSFVRPSTALVRLWSTLVLLIRLPVFGLLGRVLSENVTIEELSQKLARSQQTARRSE